MAVGEASADVEMQLDLPRGGGVPSFEFAFNSPNFSDRMLRLEIVAASCVRHRAERGDTGQTTESSSMMVDLPVLREETIYINSAILAARSPFFLKLFSNGMKESCQTHATIRIADEEENALKVLLSFMYSGKLTTNEPALVLDIMMAADKFEVLSCMRHCSQLLTSLPITTESALLYIEHGCSITVTAEVQPLVDTAKEFLAKKYKDLTEIPDELKHMRLAGIEAIFSSTDIHVQSEDEVYTFLLQWAREQYPESEERHRVWNSRLLPLVRFSHMTWDKLQEVLAHSDDDVDHEQTAKRITDVLLHKAYPAHAQFALAADAATCLQVPQRTYTLKPVKLVEFDRPCQQVIVFLDLTRKECSRLFPTGQIVSHFFHLAGQNFCIIPSCDMDKNTKSYSFGLWFASTDKPEDTKCLTLDFEFAARKRSSVDFVCMLKDKVIDTSCDSAGGLSNIFGVEWSTFIADDNLFIDGVLHLRVNLRVVVVGQPELQT